MSATQPQTPSPAEAVRQTRCALCWAPPARSCQRQPAADHLRRWLDACTAGLITRDDLAAVVVRLVVVTKWTLIADAERAA